MWMPMCLPSTPQSYQKDVVETKIRVGFNFLHFFLGTPKGLLKDIKTSLKPFMIQQKSAKNYV